jgi:hypothetical protein
VLQKVDVVVDGGCGDAACAALVDEAQAAGAHLFVDDGVAHAEQLHGFGDAAERFGVQGEGTCPVSRGEPDVGSGDVRVR